MWISCCGWVSFIFAFFPGRYFLSFLKFEDGKFDF